MDLSNNVKGRVSEGEGDFTKKLYCSINFTMDWLSENEVFQLRKHPVTKAFPNKMRH